MCGQFMVVFILCADLQGVAVHAHPWGRGRPLPICGPAQGQTAIAKLALALALAM